MSLDMRTENCVDPRALWADPEVGVTNTLAIMSIAVGLSEVTAQNVDEWMHRLEVLAELYGAPMVSADGPMHFSREHIERRIGTRVNVSLMTREEFDEDVERRHELRRADAERR